MTNHHNSAARPTDAILESISDGVFTVDRDWRVTSFNRAAEEITGIPREEAIGKPCCEVFRSSMCEAECALRSTLETGKPIINKACYIIDASGERVPISVSTAVLRNESGTVIGGAETFRDLSEIEALRKDLEGRFRIGELVSRSSAMRDVFDVVSAVAASSSTVLIQGETGTGKELVARAIHTMGPRAEKPFVAVNCGALPDSLLESELFGHCRGAFTGATADRPGRFEAAADGTLFLDEIGDVSPALQVRLLRVLQERVYEPLGSTDSKRTDARIIGATNKDLDALVKEGRFRLDLYYRMNVIRIDLPPLRARKEDIPLLADQFVSRFNHVQQRNVQGIAPEVLALLMAHDWPGNIRELENVIERAFVMCTGDRIQVKHLPAELGGGSAPQNDHTTIDDAARAAEAQAIRAALERNRFNRSAAARDLGIHPTTLYRKMTALDIPLPEKDGRSRTGQ
jgi:PAS domain S-box-containing protein